MGSLIQLDSSNDVISSVKFSPKYNHLLVSGWDGRIDLFNADLTKTQKLLSIRSNSTILDTCFNSQGTKAFSSATDGTIRVVDLENGSNDTIIGRKTQKGIANLSLISGSNELLIGASWDGQVQYLDINNNKVLHSHHLPEKVISMDCTQDKIIFSMTNRLIHIYDVRNLNQPLQIRESGLKYQSKDVKCMPNSQGFAESSIEGRVAIEYFDADPKIQEKKYAFKCHRVITTEYDIVSPVNALCFNNHTGGLFTGGSDQFLCLWDYEKRKRLKRFSKFDLSVVKLDVNHNNSVLAVATSDDSYKNLAEMQQYDETKRLKSKVYLKALSE